MTHESGDDAKFLSPYPTNEMKGASIPDRINQAMKNGEVVCDCTTCHPICAFRMQLDERKKKKGEKTGDSINHVTVNRETYVLFGLCVEIESVV